MTTWRPLDVVRAACAAAVPPSRGAVREPAARRSCASTLVVNSATHWVSAVFRAEWTARETDVLSTAVGFFSPSSRIMRSTAARCASVGGFGRGASPGGAFSSCEPAGRARVVLGAAMAVEGRRRGSGAGG